MKKKKQRCVQRLPHVKRRFKKQKNRKVRNTFKQINLIGFFSEKFIQNEIYDNEENVKGSEEIKLSRSIN